MKKKSFAIGGMLVSSLALLLGVSCNSGGGGESSGGGEEESSSSQLVIDGGYGQHDINITVWAADAVAQTFSTQIASWVEEVKGTWDVGYRVQAVGEGSAASNMLTDPEAGADVYCFAQDQLARLVQGGALSELSSSVATRLTGRNDTTSVAAATVGSKMYAYPLTSDNGYFMYYDKDIFPDQADGSPNANLENMTTIISTLKANNNAKFYYNLGSAWYNASYFFGAGCKSEWETDTSGAFVDYDDNYNSEDGRYALMATYELESETNIFVDGSDAAAAFAAGAGICVSGTWDVNNVEENCDNWGATDLPSVTDGRGETWHLGGFSGCKLIGVKPMSDGTKLAACQDLADYLTDEEAQLGRYTAHGWGPSNKNAQEDDAVKSDVALSALNLQNQYAVPQGQYPGGWWDLAGALPASFASSSAHDLATATSMLTDYESAISSYTTA